MNDDVNDDLNGGVNGDVNGGVNGDVNGGVNGDVNDNVVNDPMVRDMVSRELQTHGLCAQDIVDLVQAWAPMMVRIRGGYISVDRPSVWFGEEGKYAFSQYRGQNVSTVGSGWVWCVYEKTDRQTGRRQWVIHIYTARHVLYDQSECDRCSFTFYDYGGEAHKPLTVTGHDGEYVGGDTERDYSRVRFTTEDVCLGEELVRLWDRRREVVGRVKGKVEDSRCRAGDDVTGDDDDSDDDDDDTDVVNSPVLVLGFPHGKQLYATLGRLRDVERKAWNGYNTTVQYSADSCVGNSGGLVLPVARLDSVLKYCMPSHPHSGATTTPGVGLSAGFEVAAW